ncbi:proline dehydrogenase [Cohnella endophytica]|uniref:proline dehydrogenase n=1 Tax=Cohnella endophytica TaxID=2419778 RepID=A0A494Y024_9BACL|nr:proline dehydrogenase [Cohnella endophytica]RKP56094.1 proline dehydrogenase [Cohnella endophytica]
MIARDFFLFLSKNALANRTARKWGLRFGANRFVAGETLQTAIQTVRELNSDGIEATLDHLGEFVSSPEEANAMMEYCLRTLDAIQDSGVRSNLSLKLTQLGLDISADLCLSNMKRILDRARQYGNFVRIDMEDYARNERTLEMFEQLRGTYVATVGVVIQAYLRKSIGDIERLASLKPNLRLVKGAYKEPQEVAYPLKSDVDSNFIRLIESHLLHGNFAAVATHDEKIIGHVKSFAAERGIPPSRFEFQMLYGIRSYRQKELAREGYAVRVYVPFGTDWYGYFMRRLAERPANVWFVVRSMFRR